MLRDALFQIPTLLVVVVAVILDYYFIKLFSLPLTSDSHPFLYMWKDGLGFFHLILATSSTLLAFCCLKAVFGKGAKPKEESQ